MNKSWRFHGEIELCKLNVIIWTVELFMSFTKGGLLVAWLLCNFMQGEWLIFKNMQKQLVNKL